jgi:hypothetical protein
VKPRYPAPALSLDWRGLVARTNMLLPGIYAWVSTVASPAFARSAPLLSRVTAIAALLLLLAGPFVALARPGLGRAIGVWGGVGLSAVTWLLADASVAVQALEPVRASLGAIAWALFAFGWGSVRTVGSVPEEDPHAILGAPLRPRTELPRSTWVVFGIGLGGALIPLLLAWRVGRPGHALLAHAVAVACAIALVTSAARIALRQGNWTPIQPARARLGAASRPLAVVTVVLMGGLVWSMLR